MCELLLLLRCHDIYIGTFVDVRFPWWFEFHPTQPTFVSKTRFSVDPTIVWLFLRRKQVQKAFHYNKSSTLPLPVPKQSPPIFSWSLILSNWSANIVSKRQGHEGLYCLSGLVGKCCYDVSDVLSINHGIGNYIVLTSSILYPQKWPTVHHLPLEFVMYKSGRTSGQVTQGLGPTFTQTTRL